MSADDYRFVNSGWHMLRTATGLYFATSREAVFLKAGVRPPAPANRFAEIAAQEQAACLAQNENQKGQRHLLKTRTY